MAAAPAATNHPNSLAVEMSVSVTSENPPVITGTTNLPNGTVLSVFMFGEPPACVPHCGIGPADTIVQDGRFTIGTKLTGTEKLLTALYTIDVTMMSHGQSDPTVKSAIGLNGANLRGSYVAALGDGPGVGYIPIKFPRTSPPSEGERHLGLDIHYTQRVFVASDAASDDAVRSRAVADFRKSSVENCRLQTGFANLATGGELGTEQRQVIMDACIAESERKLTSAMISPPAPPPARSSGRTIDPEPSSPTKTFAPARRYDPKSPVKVAYGHCLNSHAKEGPYNSFDGGKSALTLMAACKSQWEAWVNECIAEGGTDGGEGGCTMQSGILAQLSIKLVGK
ncbi:MAG: hypothetical protein ABSG03_39575 [Bryobacteraceae bacterium]